MIKSAISRHNYDVINNTKNLKDIKTNKIEVNHQNFNSDCKYFDSTQMLIPKETKEPSYSPVKEQNSPVTPILVTSFNINNEISNNVDDCDEENKCRLSRIPTSSFNHDNSNDTSEKSNYSMNKDIEKITVNSLYNQYINSSKPEKETSSQNLLPIQKDLTNGIKLGTQSNK